MKHAKIIALAVLMAALILATLLLTIPAHRVLVSATPEDYELASFEPWARASGLLAGAYS